jgi:hypothetical protein
MSLEADLKDKALALISQQMARWVVEIQRQIGQHQANLVRSLDELQETVARYDERIDENEVGQGMAEVVALQPPPPPPPPPPAKGPGIDRLRASIAQIEKGASLSEVLTHLVNEVSTYVDRAAMFIVKGTSAIGWYGKGIDSPDVVKQLNVPLGADTVFRLVSNSRHALRGHVSHSPGTAQALARMGGSPGGVMAVPLILRDKVAAVLYCDTREEEVPGEYGDAIEVMVSFAGKVIDLLSLAPRPAAGAAPAAHPAPAPPPAASGTGPQAAVARPAHPPQPTPATNPPQRPAAAPARTPTVDDIRAQVGLPPSRPAAAPAVAPAAGHDEGASTVMFNAQQFAALRQQVGTPPQRPAATTAAPPAALSPEEQKAHEDAKRFARLVVSEIKLYNEAKVAEGRRQKDIYERLKEDIERGRQMYNERIPAGVRDHSNYFFDELVRILAGGDAGALGPM